MAGSKIMALIPAYNEGSSIAAVVEGALAFLPVLVVDDGSSDATAAAAEAAGARVLCQVPNQGKGAALQAGFKQAIEEDFQAAVTLDADGQHDPAEIPKFLDAYHARGADLIIGRRDFGQIPPLRRLANFLGSKVFSWAVGQPVPDNQSGYRLLSRRLMKEMLTSEESGFEYELDMILTAIQHNYALDSVPIRTIYAGESSHINNREHLKNFLRFTGQARRATQDKRR